MKSASLRPLTMVSSKKKVIWLRYESYLFVSKRGISIVRKLRIAAPKEMRCLFLCSLLLFDMAIGCFQASCWAAFKIGIVLASDI